MLMKRPMKKLKGIVKSQFTVYLPDDLDRQMRELALLNGRTLSEETVRTLRAGRRFLSIRHK